MWVIYSHYAWQLHMHSWHVGRFWDPKSLPYAFDSFSIRSSSSLRADISTVLRHCRSPKAPPLCACFEPVQNKRQDWALQVAHGDPVPLLTRDQIALRDLVSLCITLLYLRTRSGSAIMNVGRCDCNYFLLWRTDNCQKKRVDWWGRRILYISVAQAQCACCKRTENV